MGGCVEKSAKNDFAEKGLTIKRWLVDGFALFIGMTEVPFTSFLNAFARPYGF